MIGWMNEKGQNIVDIILNPFNMLPGFMKFLVLIVIGILAVIGLFVFAKKALKSVVGVACVFIVVLIAWILLSK